MLGELQNNTETKLGDLILVPRCLRSIVIDSEPEVESLAITFGCDDVMYAEQVYAPASPSRR